MNNPPQQPVQGPGPLPLPADVSPLMQEISNPQQTPKKKSTAKIILLIVGIGMFFALLTGAATWFIFSTLSNQMQIETEIITPENFDDIFRHIQEPLRFDSHVPEDPFFHYDDIWTDAHINNLLEISDQTVQSRNYNQGPGTDYAQNPRQIISALIGDGSYLFIYRDKTIHIVSTTNGGIEEAVASIELAPLEGTSSSQLFVSMFLADNRLIIIEGPDDSRSPASTTSEPARRTATSALELTDEIAFTTVHIIDVSTPASPSHIDKYAITGFYSGSRIMGTNLYLSTEYSLFGRRNISQENPETFVPHVVNAEGAMLVLPENVRMAPDSAWWPEVSYTHLVGINFAGSTDVTSQIALLGNTEDFIVGAYNALAVVVVESFGSSLLGEYFGGGHEETSHLLGISFDEGELSFTQAATIDGRIMRLSENGGIFYALSEVFLDRPLDAFDLVSSDGLEGLDPFDMGIELTAFALDEHMKIIGELEISTSKSDLWPIHFLGSHLYLEAFDFRYETEIFYHMVDFSDPNALRQIEDVDIPLLPMWEESIWSWDTLPEAINNEESDHSTEQNYWVGMREDFDAGHRFRGYDLVLFGQVDSQPITEIDVLALHNYEGINTGEDIAAFFVDPATNIIALPTKESLLVFTYDTERGFVEVAQLGFATTHTMTTPVRVTTNEDNLFITQFSDDQIDIKSYSLSDFSEQGHLALRD